MPSRPLKEHEIAVILSLPLTKREAAFITLGIYTGYRVSELLCITVKDVFDGVKVRDSVTVSRKNMKGKGESRTIPLHKVVKEYLSSYITASGKPSDRLFPFSRFTAHRLVKHVIGQAGLSGRVSCHSMRKTFGMNVYNRTQFNIVAAQKALGHKSLASTTHYLSVDSEAVDAAILAE